MFLLLNIALSVISLLMSVVNVCTGEFILLAVTLLFGAACLINVLVLRLARRVTAAVYVLFGAETIAQEVGDGGECCRWGGEEFLIVSRLTDTTAGMADRICRRIAERTFFCADGGTLTVTVSAGVCCAPQMCDAGIHKMIDLADKALYRSKRDGGNRATGIWWDPAEGQATTGTVGSGTPTE